MALVKITAGAEEITAEPGSSVDVAFDVINALDSAVRIGIDVIGPLKEKGWVKVDGPVEVDLPPRGHTKLKVTVSVPANAEAGTQSFKLRVYDARNPENADESGAIAATVPAKVAPPPPPPDDRKKINWPLIIGASVGGLVLVGGIITAVLMLGGDKVPDLANLELKAAEEALIKAELKLGNYMEIGRTSCRERV